MPVFTLQVGDVLRIGPDVTLEVIGVEGEHFWLGIKAPGHLKIHCTEVTDDATDRKSDPSQSSRPDSDREN